MRYVSGSFVDPVYDFVSSSSSGVVDYVSVVEEFDGGESFDVVFSGTFFLYGGIYFG